MRYRGIPPRGRDGEGASSCLKQELHESKHTLSRDAANELVPPNAFSEGVRVYTKEQRHRSTDEEGWAKWQKQFAALRNLVSLQEMGIISEEEATRRAAAVLSGESIKDD